MWNLFRVPAKRYTVKGTGISRAKGRGRNALQRRTRSLLSRTKASGDEGKGGTRVLTQLIGLDRKAVYKHRFYIAQGDFKAAAGRTEERSAIFRQIFAPGAVSEAAGDAESAEREQWKEYES